MESKRVMKKLSVRENRAMLFQAAYLFKILRQLFKIHVFYKILKQQFKIYVYLIIYMSRKFLFSNPFYKTDVEFSSSGKS